MATAVDAMLSLRFWWLPGVFGCLLCFLAVRGYVDLVHCGVWRPSACRPGSRWAACRSRGQFDEVITLGFQS